MTSVFSVSLIAFITGFSVGIFIYGKRLDYKAMSDKELVLARSEIELELWIRENRKEKKDD